MKINRKILLSVFLMLCIMLCGCGETDTNDTETSKEPSTAEGTYTINTVPDFTSEPYVEINNNIPYFEPDEYTTTAFEDYSELDSLGRCSVAYACVCTETMPTEKRGSIGQVKPSGWQTVKYGFVDGKYLYNRCHLIGYQLTAENANEKNLITGTRYLNVEGMLPFENMIADYVKETDNHVLYRVTPVFDNDNLVARGVEMEAYSVEDDGEGVCFNVYAYNNQPGVTIDYLTGISTLSSETSSASEPKETQESSASSGNTSNVTEEKTEYILNTNNKKIHLPTCSSVSTMKDKNKETYTGTLSELIDKGYTPCSKCLPSED